MGPKPTAEGSGGSDHAEPLLAPLRHPVDQSHRHGRLSGLHDARCIIIGGQPGLQLQKSRSPFPRE
eukprot:8863843-Lingulodinium_polyedra.AAC.1